MLIGEEFDAGGAAGCRIPPLRLSTHPSIHRSVLDTYSSASVELKRLDSTAYSPIFAHFGETESGLSTIRAFRRTERFREKHKLLLNRSNICMWPLLVISRWLTTRLLLLGAITAYLTALFTSAAGCDPTSC